MVSTATAPLLFLAACSNAGNSPVPTVNTVVRPSPITELVKTLEPVVVRLTVQGTDATFSGSGFIVDARGYVVTNQHLVNQSAQARVTVMSGEVFTATVVASDVGRDIAVLKISSSRSDFPAAVLGTSDGIQVGEAVLCAGFPLGAELPGPATFSDGIVSALRNLGGKNFIQTDILAINVGSSGSPVVDMKGNVIGIAVAGVLPSRVDAEGIGLVIPIDEARPFIRKVLPR